MDAAGEMAHDAMSAVKDATKDEMSDAEKAAEEEAVARAKALTDD